MAVLCACPARLAAQLVRQDNPAPSSGDLTAKKTPSGKRRVSQEVQITGEQSWSDTGIDVQPGEHIVVTATGKLHYAEAKEDSGPDGITRGFRDLLRILPFNAAGRGALIGRVGDAEIAQPFFLGAHRDFVAPVAGRLAIGINQASDDTGEGTYTVHIDIHAPDSNTAYHPVRQVKTISGVGATVFGKVPRRIADKDGNPGDMVNFLVLGSEDAMQKVFTAAGWVKVDADVRGTVLRGIIESISKESYLTMPMSPLYLFGRSQDYGWAHAEPIKVVASRNHLRIWKAPFEIDGRTLWVGAATHDIGFERDERNDGITHKIDPDVDLERDYVEKTLTSTGLVAEVTHVLPADALKEARTATGGSFHSDGRVLILKLNESAGAVSTKSSSPH
ncbi:MAG TPA: LssY C-terminal domain-containing protein [Candidatus Acidoferrum sp.]|nr:LssY C-terminal domain-containing protein [Candidatus Acidoferrum sp.]